MNDFEYDSMQKKKIARQEKYHNRRKKGCVLPSDYLTDAQKRKLNGEVFTVDMNKPITYAEYKRLPKSLQEDYYNNLVETYGIGNPSIARMMGIAEATLRQHTDRMGLDLKRIVGKPSYAKMVRFEEFCNQAEEQEEQAEMPKVMDEPQIRQEQSICRLAFEWHEVTEWTEILRFVGNMPIPKNARVRMTIEEWKDGDSAL